MGWVRRWSRVVPVAVVAMGVASFGMPNGADAATGYCYGYPATISGSGVIWGTGGNDVIVGSDVQDHINGLGGNDIISGSTGNAGNDRLTGNDGNDQLIGEYDNDQIVGGSGSDHLDGGGGDDNLYDILHSSSGWPFSNRILGQSGFDKCSYWTYEYKNNAWRSARNLFSTCEAYNPTTWTGSIY